MESLPESATEQKITFEVNEKFDNLANLEKKIEEYERENFVVLYITETLVRWRKQFPRRK